MVRAASVFALVRKRGEVEVPEAMGDAVGKDWAGFEESELRD